MNELIYRLLLNAQGFISGINDSLNATRSLQDAIDNLRGSAGDSLNQFSESSLDSFYRMEQAANRLHATFNKLKGGVRELFEVGSQSQSLDTSISFMSKNIHAEVGDINTALAELTASGQRSILGAKQALKSALSLNIPLDTAVASIKSFSNALAAAGKSQDTVVAIFESIRTMQSQRLDEYGITLNIDQAIEEEIRYVQQLKSSGQYVEEYVKILNRFNNSAEIRKDNLRQEEILQLGVNRLAREALQIQTSYSKIREVSQRSRMDGQKLAGDYEADAEAMGIFVVKMGEMLKAREAYKRSNPGTTDKEAQQAVAKDTLYKPDELTAKQEKRNKSVGIGGKTSENYFAGSGDKHKPLENFQIAQAFKNADIPEEAYANLRKRLEEGNLSLKELQKFYADFKISQEQVQSNVYAGVSSASMDTVQNKIDIIKSSITQMKVDVGSEILKIFSAPITAISELVNWISNLSETAKKNIAMLIVAITGFIGAISTTVSTMFLFRAVKPLFEPIISSLRALHSVFILVRNTSLVATTAVSGFIQSAMRFADFEGIPGILWRLATAAQGAGEGLSRLGSMSFNLGGILSGARTAITGLVARLFTFEAAMVSVGAVTGIVGLGISNLVGIVLAAAAGFGVILTVLGVFVGLGGAILSVMEALKEFKRLSEGPAELQKKSSVFTTIKTAIEETEKAFSGIKAAFLTFMQIFTGEGSNLKGIGAGIIGSAAKAFSYIGGVFEKVIIFIATYAKTLKKVYDDPASKEFFKNLASGAGLVVKLFGQVVTILFELTMKFYSLTAGMLSYVNVLGVGKFFGSVQRGIDEAKKTYAELEKLQEENRKKQEESDKKDKDREARKKQYDEDKQTIANLSTRKDDLTKDEQVKLDEASKRVTEYENSSEFDINKTGMQKNEEEKLQEMQQRIQLRISYFEELKKLSEHEAKNQEEYLEVRKEIFKDNIEDYRKMIGAGFQEGGYKGLSDVVKYRLKGINEAIELFNLTLDKYKKANELSKKLVSSNKELIDAMTAYFFDSKISSAKRYDEQLSGLLEKSKSIELARTNLSSMRKEIDLARAEALTLYQKFKNPTKGTDVEQVAGEYEDSLKRLAINRVKFLTARENYNSMVKDFELESEKQDFSNRLKMNQFEILAKEPRTGNSVLTSYSQQLNLMIGQMRLQSKNGEDLLLDATNQFSGVYSKIFSKMTSVVNENYVGVGQALSAYEIMSKNVENSLKQMEGVRGRVNKHYEDARLQTEALQKMLFNNAKQRELAASSNNPSRIKDLDSQRLMLSQKLEQSSNNQKEAGIALANVDAQRNVLLKTQLDIIKQREELAKKELDRKLELLGLESKFVEIEARRLNSIGEYEAANKLILSSNERARAIQSESDAMLRKNIDTRARNSDIIAKNVPGEFKFDPEQLRIVGKWVELGPSSGNLNTDFAKSIRELSDIQIVNPKNVSIGGTSLEEFIKRMTQELGLKPDLLERISKEKTEDQKRKDRSEESYLRYGIKDVPASSQEIGEEAQSFLNKKFEISDEVSTSNSVFHVTHMNHEGFDTKTPTGTPLVSPLKFNVKHTGFEAGYGNNIVGSIADDLYMRFAHLSKISTRGGVQGPGTTLGFTGNTGGSYGPHLHQEMFIRTAGNREVYLDRVIQGQILNLLKRNPDLSGSDLERIKNIAFRTQSAINDAEKNQNKKLKVGANLPESVKLNLTRELTQEISFLTGAKKATASQQPAVGSATSTSAIIPRPPILPESQPLPSIFVPTRQVDEKTTKLIARSSDSREEKQATSADLNNYNKLKGEFEKYESNAEQKSKKIALIDKQLGSPDQYALSEAEEKDLAGERKIAEKELGELVNQLYQLQKQINSKFFRKDKSGRVSALSYTLNPKLLGMFNPGTMEDPKQLSGNPLDPNKTYTSALETTTSNILQAKSSNLFDGDIQSGFIGELIFQQSALRKGVQEKQNELLNLESKLKSTTDPVEYLRLEGAIQRLNDELKINLERFSAVSSALDKVSERVGRIASGISASFSKNFDNFADQISGSFGAAFKSAMNEPTDSRDVRTWWERFSDSYKEAGSTTIRDSLTNFSSEILALPQKAAFDSMKEWGGGIINKLKNNVIGAMAGVDTEKAGELAKQIGENTGESNVEKAKSSIATAGEGVAQALQGVSNQIKTVAQGINPATPTPTTATTPDGNPIPPTKPGEAPGNNSDPGKNGKPPDDKAKVGAAMKQLNDTVSAVASAGSMVMTLAALSTNSVKKVDQKIKDVNDIFESNENVRGVVVGEQNIGIGKLNELFQPIAVDLHILVQTLQAQFGAIPASSSNLGIANNSLAVTVSGKIDLNLVENPSFSKEVHSMTEQALVRALSQGETGTTGIS